MRDTANNTPDMETALKCVLRADGAKEWQDTGGKRHRVDGPAVVYPNGSEEWWVSGCRHREDGPAIAFKCGMTKWYRDGVLHCLCGPAVVNVCGCRHTDGKCNMTDEGSWAPEEYFVNGRRLSACEYYLAVDTIHKEIFSPPGRWLWNVVNDFPTHE